MIEVVGVLGWLTFLFLLLLVTINADVDWFWFVITAIISLFVGVLAFSDEKGGDKHG